MVGSAQAMQANDPTASTVVASPSTRPTRTVTSFDESLRCMDELLLQYGKRDLKITTEGLPDKTGVVNVGTREMMISALDAMSQQSRAFIFYDVDNERSSSTDPERQRHEVRVPYYIAGAITQVDQGVMGDGKSGGVALSALSLGKSKAQDVTNLSIDMGIFNKGDDSALTGVRAQNTIRIIKTGQMRNIEGLVSFGSINYSVKSDRSEGSHQAVRTLIELSMIELVGKFTSVPYWRCLSMPSTDPLAQRTALKFYQAMTPASRISAVQNALTRMQEQGSATQDEPRAPEGAPRMDAAADEVYRGPVDGTVTPQFAEAVARYRARTGLTPGTQVDFDLYYSMLNRNMTLAVSTGLPAPRGAPPSMPVAAAAGLDFTLDLGDPVRVKGDRLLVLLKPRKTAYFYCYMSTMGPDGAPAIMRLYPNQFSGAATPIEAGATLRIPADESEFSLKLTDVGEERVACVARARPYDAPGPSTVTNEALTAFTLTPARPSEKPADVFARQIRALVDQHQTFDRKGLESVVRVGAIRVAEKGEP
ncbi:hypothetical protein AS593_19725 [Caulobacter vibrioides]|nr:hypothetical protein AS593_19725 [Caulobacter vibrioides]